MIGLFDVEIKQPTPSCPDFQFIERSESALSQVPAGPEDSDSFRGNVRDFPLGSPVCPCLSNLSGESSGYGYASSFGSTLPPSLQVPFTSFFNI